MDDRKFFDHLSETWDDNEILSTSKKVNQILDLIGFNDGNEVLDLGTGTGVLLPYIAERIGPQGKITAIDFSEGMLEKAKTKFSALSPPPCFMNLDFENETIPGEYDRILLYCVYPHLHSPLDTLKWLKKVNLKKDGVISIAFPCGPDYINNIHKQRHSESDILPSASNLVEILKNAGLEAELIHESKEAYIVNIY